MTLFELAQQYQEAAGALRGRIAQLERAAAQGEEDRLQLEGRLRPLRAMYRETRAIARYLEGYYGYRGRRA